MKDLSRQEEIVRLEKLIAEKDSDLDKEQGKRIKRTFLALSGVVYLIAFMSNEMNGIKDYLTWLIVAPIMAGLFMFASSCVLNYVMNGALRRAETISELKGRLFEAKYGKFTNHEDENAQDIKMQLDHVKVYLEVIVDEYRSLEFNEDNKEKQLEDLKGLLEAVEAEYKLLINNDD